MKILFVCTGNSCRSPMAEALYLKAASQAGRHDETISRGTSIGEKNLEPIGATWPSSQVMMQYYGIDISQHVPKGISADDISWADLILTMTKHHANELRRTFGDQPGSRFNDKVHTYGNYIGLPGSNIEDPIGQGYNEYLKCAKQLESWAKLLVVKLNALDAKTRNGGQGL